MEHDLKIWPGFFDAVLDGSKTFELRWNDRGFAVGDVLQLREYSPGTDTYTGREATRQVSYILDGSTVDGAIFGVKPGFVVLALKSLGSD